MSYILKPGDLIIGMERTFTKSGVKITKLLKEDCPSLLVQRVGRFLANHCDFQYLKWIVQSPAYLHTLQNQQKGMDIPHLSKSEILGPEIPIPRETEQKEIERRVDAAHSQIESEMHSLEKLQKQKSGLMHDLLTGRVPVTPDPEPEEASDV